MLTFINLLGYHAIGIKFHSSLTMTNLCGKNMLVIYGGFFYSTKFFSMSQKD